MKQYNLVNNILGWLTFAIAAFTYCSTVEPTASFWDCPEFITTAYKLEVGHPPGAPFFMLTGNFFTQFTSDPSKVAFCVNIMSALLSALCILFLFWTITHLARKLITPDGKVTTLTQLITIMGCGLTGALAYTWSDTFWFSAVEGEVYAYSSMFTALVFWLILKWEDHADEPHSDRWLVLIFYLTGLSIGVHLLNLLCLPAISLVYYYKRNPQANLKGSLVALIISMLLVAAVLYGVVPGIVKVGGWFEWFFTNDLGLSFNVGMIVYLVILVAVVLAAIWSTTTVNHLRTKVLYLLSVALLGIPFMGKGTISIVIGLIVLAALYFLLDYKGKDGNYVVRKRFLNTSLLCMLMLMIGYSSYAIIVIRSAQNPPMDQNSPEDVFTLGSYMGREQYGQTPLLKGEAFCSQSQAYQVGAIGYQKSKRTQRVEKANASEPDRYEEIEETSGLTYPSGLTMLFPRIHSAAHTSQYQEWLGDDLQYKDVTFTDNEGNTYPGQMPTQWTNLKFFLSYQVNFMYWRYFMWNFSGRQNDIQGNGEVLNGNWITGIPFIDEVLVGPQEDMPFDIINNKGHNVYYMLPLLLGILGLLFQAYSGQKGIQSFWVTFFLFFMTGLAIVLYLNQTPYQPRERDYAYAGSFYAFCIWIGFGVAALAKGLERYAKLNPVIAGSVATVLCLFVPIQMAGQNWDDHDRSGRYVCRDFGSNYLESCEPNAIIFTNGDNDTFPLWYAQEVEGVRTDVRVCNTSYLQTDWYIDQMKKQAYESAPLPITWTRDQYIQGTRDAAYVFPLTKDSIDLNTALNFVRSDDPKFKKIPGINQELDYIPADKLYYKVDSVAGAKILGGKTDGMVDRMMINLAGKNALGKQELTILDMLQTNNFERPMYYAITVSPDQFVNLDGYFEQTGLAYQVVPKNANKAVNTDKMYDNVMNKFKWGGVDKPGVYIDENVMRMCKSYRMMLFNKLAEALVKEGKNDKALNVLDKCMQVLPPENVPLDYTALSTGELYYVLGQKEKAEEIFTGIADNMMRNINWYFRLNPMQLSSVETELLQDMQILNQVLLINKHYNPEFNKKYQEEFDNYRMAYESVGHRE